MTTFKINGNEHELKLTFKAVRLLNSAYDGGSYELIGKALSGDTETFLRIVHAGLLHTEKNYSLKDVEQAIEALFVDEAITFDDMQKISAAVVTESFFYKPTLDKMLAQDKKMKKAYEVLMK